MFKVSMSLHESACKAREIAGVFSKYTRKEPYCGLRMFAFGRALFMLEVKGWPLRTINRTRFALYNARQRVSLWRDEIVRRGRSNKLVRALLGLRYSVAVYELDRAYGGPEEGGWWFDCGDLVRVVKRFRNEGDALRYANRMNERLYSRMYHYRIRSRSSMAYDGGEYRAKVYASKAPKHFPEGGRPFWDE